MTDLRELRRLEPWFHLAPSAHNTQPWVVEYERDRIGLGFDPERHLRVGDPTKRDLLLSLGAFAECVLIAAASEGTPLRFDADRREFRAAASYATPFGLEGLAGRRTSRLPYHEPLPAEVLAAARAQIRAEERLHRIGTDEVLPLFEEADRHVYDTPPVVEELRSWLRLSPRHPRYEQDGLSYECLGMSRATAAAFGALLHPRAYAVVRALRVHRRFTAAARSVLATHGTVLVLDAPQDGETGLLESGRSLLRVWLALAKNGCAAHPLSQILDYEPAGRELGELVKLAPGRRIVSVFRAGRSELAPRSHRRVSL